MGVVYRALDLRLERAVAIKVLREDALANPERHRRFAHEAKAASALSHPNIVTIYDIGQDGGTSFIAMEFVPGKTLDELIGTRGLPLPQALKYAVQISGALATAHSAGIIHRDLKPANVMVTEQGLVKLLDFGLAKLTETAPLEQSEAATRTISLAETTEGRLLGTVSYMSPEQAQGLPVDARSDVFSFGALLYEMITGRSPFRAQTKVATLAAILRSEPEPFGSAVEPASPELERIVLQCLRKELGRRFQDMADVRIALEDLVEESDSRKRVPAVRHAPSGRVLRAGLAAASVVALAAVVLFVASRWERWRIPPAAPLLTRVTTDLGLTTDPALSPDGKLLAYASDRGGEGNLNIWVQQLAGGEPIQLTRDEADDYEAAFSPDGSKIVFRSDRDGGGIYVVPALGGDTRIVARSGRRPRVSPDGEWIAYWAGDTHFSGAKVFIIPVGGGQTRQIQPDFAHAQYPIWVGAHELLFFGGRRSRPSESSTDWWVASIDGNAAIPTGAFTLFDQHRLKAEVPGDWIRDTGSVIFSAPSGDSENLWQISLSRKTWRVDGTPQRVTIGTGLESQPSGVQGGLLAFTSGTSSIGIWRMPILRQPTERAGDMARVTRDVGEAVHPSLSQDGTRLAFCSNKGGNFDVWLKDLSTGREVSLTSSSQDDYGAIISADGSKLAYGTTEENKAVIYAVNSAGGLPQRVCDACGSPEDWSAGTDVLLYGTGKPRRIAAVNVTTGAKTELLGHASYDLWAPRFSPDGGWIAFYARSRNPEKKQIFVIPARRGSAPPEREWIAVTDGSTSDREPRWSHDGSTLYFTSDRDGFGCIWRQPLDVSTKKPLGAPFVFHHFHNARYSLANIGSFQLTVARDWVALNLTELKGNIWKTQLPR